MAHKYGAKKVTIDGITFDSKAESIYYQLHKHEPNMKMQVPFVLQGKFRRAGTGKMVREIKYIADFVFYNSDGSILKIVDVKGQILPMFLLKAKWLESCYGIPVTIAKKVAYKNEFIEEVYDAPKKKTKKKKVI